MAAAVEFAREFKVMKDAEDSLTNSNVSTPLRANEDDLLRNDLSITKNGGSRAGSAIGRVWISVGYE
jgi:hypothetical protein